MLMIETHKSQSLRSKSHVAGAPVYGISGEETGQHPDESDAPLENDADGCPNSEHSDSLYVHILTVQCLKSAFPSPIVLQDLNNPKRLGS